MKLRLRNLREDNDMSQAEMAKIQGVSQQTYSRYESHTTEIPLESLIFLADFTLQAWTISLASPTKKSLILEITENDRQIKTAARMRMNRT